MDSRFRRSQSKKGYGKQAEEMTGEKRLWTAGRGDERKKGYRQPVKEITDEKRRWTAGR